MAIAHTLLSVTRNSKRVVTLSNVTSGNLPHMDEEAWRRCQYKWDRLRWARERKFQLVKEGAVAVGMKPGTYGAYERPNTSSKHTPLDHEHAFHFGKVFGVRWEWLMDGGGEPWRADSKSARARLAKAAEMLTEDDAATLADMAERLLKRAG